MESFLTIHQTEAHLKAYDVPVNCSVTVSGKPAIPAFSKNGTLSLHMVMLDESLVDVSRIDDLMKEYKVKRIILNSCYTEDNGNKYVRRRTKRINSNICTSLPGSMETYMSQLGAHTRRHVRAYERKFLESYPYTEFATQYNCNVNNSDFLEILRLNRERCISKGIKPGIDDQEAVKLFEVIKLYGVINIMKIDNTVIAGTIGTILGDEYTLHVISHDNLYSDFHIGSLIIKRTVEQAINDKLRVLNLTWGGIGEVSGKTNWKLQFANERRFLNDVTYYRRYNDYYAAIILEKFTYVNDTFSRLFLKILRKGYNVLRGFVKPLPKSAIATT
jgi:hypothetical protein